MSDETTTDNLPALYVELERIGAEAAQWAEVEASDSTALVHVGSADPERIRTQMIEVRREARRKSGELQKAADAVKAEIRAELDRQKGEMEVRMRAAMAALAPLQAQVKRMEEGIWTVNLYLGSSEEIVTLRTGQPASVDTPIHLRTTVLAMDEEVASFPVEEGEIDWQGMDYRDIESFDRWLTEEPEHLAQVLPEERGIVVFTPRRTIKVYDENPFVNAAMNEGNFESYWLIRNGENLYRLRTNFAVGGNLMPTTAEFTALFQRERYNRETREHEMVEITPGTREWEDAEEAQDGKRRHYMRVALIVQGLIDRTEVLQPLHAAVNVMQQGTYDDGLVVVINDMERTLTTSREPYFDWIKRLNAELRPGMRIIGNYRGEAASRTHPEHAEAPPESTLLTIEGRKDWGSEKGFVIRYKRTEKSWSENRWIESEDRPGYGHYGGYFTPKTRASAVVLPSDKSIIPFDLVTEAEMEEYLGARTERHAYASMFPLLQAAIAAKREEREAEAPFRDLLIGTLAADNGQDADEVTPHVDALVHRFKLGNKWHRPLVSMSQEEEAKALRLIRAEYKRIVDSGAGAERDEHAVKVLREHDPEVMFVGRLSSGKYVAFAPQSREYAEGAAHPNLWVREHATTKTARTITSRDWVAPGVRGNKMTTLFEAERWTDWDRLSTVADDLTDPEMDTLLAKVRAVAARHAKGEPVLAIEHDRKDRRWTAWFAGQETGTKHRPKRLGAVKVDLWWERSVGSEPVMEAVGHRVHVEGEDFDMSYGGNRGLGSGIAAHDRSVYMPWHTGSRGHFTSTEGPQSPKSTVVFEVDEEVLAAVRKRVVETQAAVDEHADYGSRIYRVLHWINEQQTASQTAAIKAAFLADYPDEEMWEERRREMTKNVRAAVNVTNQHHFMDRAQMTETSWSLHNRTDGSIDLNDALRAAISDGYVEWDGLTVSALYALLDQPVPDIYEPLSNLRLTRPAEPVGDGSDEDE